MKRLFTIIALLTIIGGSAFAQKIAYVLPEGCTYTDGSLAGFPSESTGFDAYPVQTMELNAATWFKDNFVANAKGEFITISDVKTADLSKYDLIWVNVERIALPDKTELKGNFGFDNEVVSKLKSYAQAGGNLYLSKQATWLAYYMGRIGYAPTHENAGAFESKASDDWYCTQALLGYGLPAESQTDRTGHALFAGLEKTDNADYWHYGFKMTNAEIRTANIYCSWAEFLDGNQQKNYGNADKALITTFETDWNAQCLSQRGNISDYCFMDIVEFLPGEVKGTAWNGTILCNGSNHCQWTKSNDNTIPAPITTLAANIMNYLTADVTLYEGRTISYSADFTANVTLDREFTAGRKSTIILPFALSTDQCSACGTFYQLASYNGSDVVFTPVTSTEANKPYVFVAASDGKLPTFNAVSIASTDGAALKTEVSGCYMQGAYSTQLLASAQSNGNYTYYNNAFVTTSGTITVSPFRAFVHIDGAAPAKLNITFDDTADGINSAVASDSNDDTVYTVTGIRVASPAKGLYIRNGKKFLVK